MMHAQLMTIWKTFEQDMIQLPANYDDEGSEPPSAEMLQRTHAFLEVLDSEYRQRFEQNLPLPHFSQYDESVDILWGGNRKECGLYINFTWELEQYNYYALINTENMEIHGSINREGPNEFLLTLIHHHFAN